MIVKEKVTLRKKIFIKTYSDKGVYIQDENGNKFVASFDVLEATKDYQETEVNIPIELQPTFMKK